MKAIRKKSHVIFVAIVFFSFFLTYDFGFSRILLNGAGGGYGGSGDGGESSANNTVIEYYVAEGGVFYLAADSDAQRLLELVEMQDIQGVDFQDLQAAATDALDNINRAIESYESLVSTAEITPYNEAFIQQLKTFAYKRFAEENGLNAIVFNQVKAYLKSGDITGLFKKVKADLKSIGEMVRAIHAEISLNRLPETVKFWQLNETFAVVSLFGSYSARVFGEIH